MAAIAFLIITFKRADVMESVESSLYLLVQGESGESVSER